LIPLLSTFQNFAIRLMSGGVATPHSTRHAACGGVAAGWLPLGSPPAQQGRPPAASAEAVEDLGREVGHAVEGAAPKMGNSPPMCMQTDAAGGRPCLAVPSCLQPSYDSGPAAATASLGSTGGMGATLGSVYVRVPAGLAAQLHSWGCQAVDDALLAKASGQRVPAADMHVLVAEDVGRSALPELQGLDSLQPFVLEFDEIDVCDEGEGWVAVCVRILCGINEHEGSFHGQALLKLRQRILQIGGVDDQHRHDAAAWAPSVVVARLRADGGSAQAVASLRSQLLSAGRKQFWKSGWDVNELTVEMPHAGSGDGGEGERRSGGGGVDTITITLSELVMGLHR
jgi:hypothetical protein